MIIKIEDLKVIKIFTAQDRFYRKFLVKSKFVSIVLVQINMDYYCDVCDKTIKIKSKSRHLQSLTHEEL